MDPIRVLIADMPGILRDLVRHSLETLDDVEVVEDPTAHLPLADAIERARYFDETTVMTSRGKRVAVIVGMDFYERALEALGEERILNVADTDEAPKRKVVVRRKRPAADSD